jgi:3-oxoadipate enol-lactonase
MPYAPVPYGKLFYQDEGEGTPLLMLHAGIADHTMWQPQVDAFKHRCRCIRFDHRGWGQSSTEPGKPYTRVDDVKALLDHLGVERAVIMGCSIGGAVAVNVAVFAPERALALVAIAAGINGFPEDGAEFPELPLFEQIDAHENAGEFAEAAAMEAKIWGVGPRRPLEQGNRAVYDYIYRIDYDHYINLREKGDPQPSPSAYEHLGQLSLPTLVICGEEDETPTMAMSRYMGATIPNAHLHMMPNAAHLPNMEHPDEFNRVLSAFLDTLSAV